MGFGSLATQLIFVFLFITVIGAYVVIITQHQTTVRQAEIEFTQHQQLVLSTRIDVSAQYNGTHIVANVTNEGTTVLDVALFDVYVGDERLLRDTAVRVWSFVVDTANPQLLDPGDRAVVVVQTSLVAGYHRLLITTPYGVGGADVFES